MHHPQFPSPARLRPHNSNVLSRDRSRIRFIQTTVRRGVAGSLALMALSFAFGCATVLFMPNSAIAATAGPMSATSGGIDPTEGDIITGGFTVAAAVLGAFGTYLVTKKTERAAEARQQRTEVRRYVDDLMSASLKYGTAMLAEVNEVDGGKKVAKRQSTDEAAAEVLSLVRRLRIDYPDLGSAVTNLIAAQKSVREAPSVIAQADVLGNDFAIKLDAVLSLSEAVRSAPEATARHGKAA
jgi:hypothetical protein